MTGEQINIHKFHIIAYITQHDDLILTANCLVLKASSEEEKKALTVDIAKALKADVTQLSNGDFMIIG